MDDLISRQATIKELDCANWGKEWDKALARAILEKMPTIDPVKHGEWQITEAYPHNIYCSECHVKFAQTHWAVWEDGSLPRRYCPNCGARMERSEE